MTNESWQLVFGLLLFRVPKPCLPFIQQVV